ncbi:uncharacterized protein LOC144472071 [Augochlora pura]
MPILNEDKNELFKKPRFLCLNECKISRFQRSNSQRNKQYENRDYELKTILPEKEKLLDSDGNKTKSINDNADLRKRLSSKMSVASFLSSTTKCETTDDKTLNKCDITDLDQNKNNETNATSITFFDYNKNGKSICFSDTDLKLLMKPVFSDTSGIKKHAEKVLFCEWNSGIIDNYYRKPIDTGSKSIELKFQDMDSFKDEKHKSRISNSRSNSSICSFTSKTCNSKYFSDSLIKKLDSFPNLKLKNLQRSANPSTASSVSTTIILKNENPKMNEAIIKNGSRILHIKSKTNSAYGTDKHDLISMKQLPETESEIKLYEYIKQFERMKSSVDIQLNCLKKIKCPRRKSKSDENVAYGLVFPTVRSNIKNCSSPRDYSLLTENLVHTNEGVQSTLNQQLEINETYDELGMLFSQYLKHQVQLCQKKVCPLSRHLKQNFKHSTRHCQRKFNYHKVYPYDQRPACNSGNVCADTYDELKLMCKSPSKREDIYQCMLKRRKEFLHQPCSAPIQNFSITK